MEKAAGAFHSGDWALAEKLAATLYASGERSPLCLQILGVCHSRREDRLRAAGYFEELVDLLTPGFATALASFGYEKYMLGDLEPAALALHRASALLPQDGDVAHQLAKVLHARGQYQEAITHYERASELSKESPQIENDLGAALASQKEFALALTRFDRAAKLNPAASGPVFNKAQALFSLGDTDHALTLFRKAEQQGYGKSALTMQAVIIPGCNAVSEEELLATRRRFSQTLLPQTASRRNPGDIRPAASSRLRVGYVSAFFLGRNWMKPMWGLINKHDRKKVEVHLFSDEPLSGPPPGYEPDSRDFIHQTGSLDNGAMAQLIRSQEIDILVDLNGYSCVPRLGLYPQRSAPVQLAWAGMFATSGQDSFDALVTDGVVVPPTDERFYSEPIKRLPGTHLAFDVQYEVPPIVAAPARETGRVTFGCLAPLYKLHPESLEAFSKILKRTPGSRLLLRNRGLGKSQNRNWILQQFEKLGISSSQLLLLAGAEHYDFLETYSQIDIALDTFPYNGGTTTMESLWQGVPLLTFRGRRLIERQSTTLLLAAGCSDFVAKDKEEFIERACAMAEEAASSEFSDRRMTARERLAGSLACDTTGLCRSMEKIYEESFSNLFR